MNDFQKEILAGIPEELPEIKEYDKSINHAPKRKDILTKEEKRLAIKNALRYFPESRLASFRMKSRGWTILSLYAFW